MTHTYEILADLLEYPRDDWPALLTGANCHLAANDPQLLPTLLAFCEGAGQIEVTALQEKYTQTFDLNPVCALEVGYHLFGENYKRGELLANLRETELPYELGQEHQLPDYLPVLLRLLVKLEPGELRASLIAECILPALSKMLESFGASDNPYARLLQLIRSALGDEVPKIAAETAAAMPELYRISSRADSRPKERRHHV